VFDNDHLDLLTLSLSVVSLTNYLFRKRPRLNSSQPKVLLSLSLYAY